VNGNSPQATIEEGDYPHEPCRAKTCRTIGCRYMVFTPGEYADETLRGVELKSFYCGEHRADAEQLAELINQGRALPDSAPESPAS
jgi:hypothetical protein